MENYSDGNYLKTISVSKDSESLKAENMSPRFFKQCNDFIDSCVNYNSSPLPFIDYLDEIKTVQDRSPSINDEVLFEAKTFSTKFQSEMSEVYSMSNKPLEMRLEYEETLLTSRNMSDIYAEDCEEINGDDIGQEHCNIEFRKIPNGKDLKNVTKNFMGFIKKFIKSPQGRDASLHYLQNDFNIYDNFCDFIDEKRLNSFKNLKKSFRINAAEVPQIKLFKLAFQAVSSDFIKYHSHNWIYHSKRIEDRWSHILIRRKLMRKINDICFSLCRDDHR